MNEVNRHPNLDGIVIKSTTFLLVGFEYIYLTLCVDKVNSNLFFVWSSVWILLPTKSNKSYIEFKDHNV